MIGLHLLDRELLAATYKERKEIEKPRERRVRHDDIRLVEEAEAFGAVEAAVALQLPDGNLVAIDLAVPIGVAVVDLVDGLSARLLREEIDVLALVAGGDDALQPKDLETAREVLEEIAAAWVIAVAEDGLARELRTVVAHLVLDVGELRIMLIVLLITRTVDGRVERAFHVLLGIIAKTREHGVMAADSRCRRDWGRGSSSCPIRGCGRSESG